MGGIAYVLINRIKVGADPSPDSHHVETWELGAAKVTWERNAVLPNTGRENGISF